MTARAILFQRPYPSANCVLLPGPRPVLVDTGAGSDADATEGWLHFCGVPPSQIALVVNTHHHSDHVGGNFRLGERYRVPIAMHRIEGEPVNRRDADSCRATWLDQDVEPFRVERMLGEGDQIGTGDEESGAWRVIHTPGHSPGHVSLYHEQDRLLIVGDLLHASDAGWVDVSGGTDTLDAAIASHDGLAKLEVVRALSGHGPPINDFATALAASRALLVRWRADAAGAAWHACKRIFTHFLITENGAMRASLMPALLAKPWLRDTAAHPLGLSPEAFADALIAEALRAGAATWRGDRLVASGGYVPPLPGWSTAALRPADWPPA